MNESLILTWGEWEIREMTDDEAETLLVSLRILASSGFVDRFESGPFSGPGWLPGSRVTITEKGDAS